MILTLPVLVYQAFFVLMSFVASRIGPRAHLLVLVLCLLWTATHLFFWPLALLQSLVIMGSYWIFQRKSVTVR